jgi:putative ABC transport system permease protein
VVSSLGLAGTLALGVIERRREIGLLRSAGANGRQVAGLYVGEGVLLGLAAWALAAALAAPVGRVALLVLGQALHAPLVAVYDPVGAGLWLAVVLVLSLLASSLPARSAARVSVRESLAYL